jgi:hypothetical protein
LIDEDLSEILKDLLITLPPEGGTPNARCRTLFVGNQSAIDYGKGAEDQSAEEPLILRPKVLSDHEFIPARR